MRPNLLDPLFAPATVLDGIGPKLAKLLPNVVPHDTTGRDVRVGDLLFVLPHSIIDRRKTYLISEAPEGTVVTLKISIDHHQPPPPGKGKQPYRVYGHDASNEIALTFFHARGDWLGKALPEGSEVIVSGRLERFNGRAAMVHPDHMVPVARADELPLLENVYPLTAGLSGKVLRRAILAGTDRVPDLPEWLDPEVSRRQNFPSLRMALHRLHHPTDPLDINPDSPAWRRLAYDELLAGQLALALVRKRIRKADGRPLVGNGSVERKIRAALPYSLTAAQEKAVEDIHVDLALPERMLRLLQGDVGSGKTVVALMAMARAAEAGGQSALMAPTEILARQHFSSIKVLAESAGLKTAILTGREKGRDRTETLKAIAEGNVDIVIGTHAIFQDAVQFQNLVLAIIDEQHRFGVHQRLAISAKGEAVDMLVMTATPIPRTLVLTAFGDMDVSRLTEKPAGRNPIQTVTLPLERIGELVNRLQSAIQSGQKVYWICPLVEESEEIKLMSAEDRYAALQPIFGDKVGIIHGRMSGPDKDAAMLAFKNGDTRILIGTTVIEVGVDVPDATIIVIEHAERFGLAQLHQLRGRVGRGDRQSNCVLLYKEPLGLVARQRLSVMRETEDGFRISEEDLKLRGEGELLGTKQSGAPGFRVARIERHADLLQIARDDARLMLELDPELTSPRGEALKTLLYLYGRDDAVRLLRAG